MSDSATLTQTISPASKTLPSVRRADPLASTLRTQGLTPSPAIASMDAILGQELPTLDCKALTHLLAWSAGILRSRIANGQETDVRHPVLRLTEGHVVRHETTAPQDKRYQSHFALAENIRTQPKAHIFIGKVGNEIEVQCVGTALLPNHPLPFIRFRSQKDCEWGTKDSLQGNAYEIAGFADSSRVVEAKGGATFAKEKDSLSANLREAITGICHRLVTLENKPLTPHFINSGITAARNDSLISAIPKS